MLWDDERKPAGPLPARDTISRTGNLPPAELLAESVLAKRYGWDLRLFRGQQAAGINGDSGAFRLVNPNVLLRDKNPKFEVLRVMGITKFGNFVRQLRNVFAVARVYGARRIEFPGPHRFFAGNRVGKFDIAWSIARPAPGKPMEPGLAGRFFYLDALGLKPSPNEQAGAIRQLVRPLMVPGLRQPHPAVREDDLVLHFRAGDIFETGTEIHAPYGQPPLSYYLAAVDRERPTRVWLVFEDRANPSIEAAESALRARGVDVVTQSGDLETDIRVLLSARRLVAGIGTFCTSIAALSAVPKRLYVFGSHVPTLIALGTTVVEGRDTRGEYMRAIRSVNWFASAEQLALMVSYPAEAIEFIEHPAAGSPGGS